MLPETELCAQSREKIVFILIQEFLLTIIEIALCFVTILTRITLQGSVHT